MDFFQQVSKRKELDQRMFQSACADVASSVMSKQLQEAFEHDERAVQNAIDEVLRFYHLASRTIPGHITKLEDQITYLLEPHNMMYRVVKLEDNWHRDSIGAMIATTKKDNTVVCLFPYTSRGYYYFDAKTGKKVKITKANKDSFNDEVFYFYKPFPMEKLNIRKIVEYILPAISVGDYVLVILFTLALSLLGMFQPRINSILYNIIIPCGALQPVIFIFIFMICLLISTAIITMTKSILVSRIQTKLQISIPAATMIRLLHLPMTFFHKYTTGEIYTKMQNINTLCSLIISTVISTGLTSIFSLVYISQLFAYAPSLALPSIIVLLLTIIFSVISTLGQIKLSKKIIKASSDENSFNLSLISGIQKIKLTGSEKRFFSRWLKLYSKGAKLQYNPPLYLKINSVLISAIGSIGTIIMYYIAITSYVSVSDYMAFNSAFGMLSGAFTSLASVALTFAQIKAMSDMVKPIFDETPEIDKDKITVQSLSGNISLNDVSFRYSDQTPWILDSFSLNIKPGEYLAVVGKTGCGKSTLIRLLLGFEQLKKGTICYDGQDIKNINLKSLRQHIGVVLQNDKLFSGDILSNISITNPRLTLDEAWEILEMVDMADFVRDLPMGLHTVISEDSGGISGGQRQRLVIARALAQYPRVLIFDEATSALDNITQNDISKKLDHLNCTKIVIAHRLSTIQQCDRIVVMDKGKIIENGTYDELIEKDGFFANLVEQQRLDT